MGLTLFCIFKCVKNSKKSFEATQKAHELSQSVRSDYANDSQFALNNESGRNLYDSLTKAKRDMKNRKGKGKGEDDIIVERLDSEDYSSQFASPDRNTNREHDMITSERVFQEST